jgi:hypothetical protein
MFSRLHTFMGGTHIDAAKNLTAELPIEAIPAPEKVVLQENALAILLNSGMIPCTTAR